MSELKVNSVITLARRKSLVEITSGKISTLEPITQIAVGSGGVGDDGEPLVPLETQSALNREEARYDIAEVTYPTQTTARYKLVIPADALPGVKISEIALVDSGGNAAAIKNMYPKQKDAGIIFEFDFDDEF